MYSTSDMFEYVYYIRCLLPGMNCQPVSVHVQCASLPSQVTKERMWGEVARSFNLPPSVTSASYACRQNFIK